VPALTVTKVCLSGLDAIALADQRSGPGLMATVALAVSWSLGPSD
jgi:hypothetical protein